MGPGVSSLRTTGCVEDVGAEKRSTFRRLTELRRMHFGRRAHSLRYVRGQGMGSIVEVAVGTHWGPMFPAGA